MFGVMFWAGILCQSGTFSLFSYQIQYYETNVMLMIQGSYRSLKCLKVLEIHYCFSRPWNPWKTVVFWSKCLKVLEFPLDNKSYNLLQSSVKISVEGFYQIPQCTVFVAFPVLRCSVTISINKKQMVLENFYLVLESPWKVLDFYV